jgi:hypothetical protein
LRVTQADFLQGEKALSPEIAGVPLEDKRKGEAGSFQRSHHKNRPTFFLASFIAALISSPPRK